MIGRVRRRNRQILSLGLAALIVLLAGGLALARGGSHGATSRQVAAHGGDGSTATTVAPEVLPGPPSSVTGTAPAPTATNDVRPGSTIAAAPTTATAPSTAPAPTGPPTTLLPAGSQVRGTVRFSPVCPVEHVPPDPACAPRPGAAHIELLLGDHTVAAQGDAGPSGDFAIPVAPGTYIVSATPVSPTPGRGCGANPVQVIVPPGAASTVAVSCDTGIR